MPPGAEVVVGGAGLAGLSAAVTGAQPAATPPLQHRRPVDLGGGLFVCGDHRDTRPSTAGWPSGRRRTAHAVLARLRGGPPTPPPPGAGAPRPGIGWWS
ncbi:hypothetical protein [Modestobacter sp. SYSU DS0657]